jgi:DnaJ-domain-containing protein 1
MSEDVPGHRKTAATSEPREPRRHERVDLYELLEISPRASLDVIQAAYRVLVRTYHPDLNATAEAASRIRQLNAAYEVLSHPPDRARYDLEVLRARRSERVVDPDHSGSGVRARPPGRSRGLPTRTLGAKQRPADVRVNLVNGPALVALLVVASVAVILLVLFVMGFDPPDYNPVIDGPPIELVGH